MTPLTPEDIATHGTAYCFFAPQHLATLIGCSEAEASSRMRLVGCLAPDRDLLRAKPEEIGEYMDGGGLVRIASRFISREEWRPNSGAPVPDREPLVYFIRCGDAVKIGYTKDIDRRLAHIRMLNPNRVEVLAMMAGAVQLERDLHTRFSAQRVHGEWFRLDGELAELLEMAPK